MKRPLEDFPVFATIGFVVAVLVGGALGYWQYVDVAHDFDTKDALRAECIKGNDRACRMYEVDYGHG